MSYSTNRIVAIPAGKCPVKLKSSEKEEVINWAENVISQGLRENLDYLPSAIIFFAQQFFNIFSEDYKAVCNHINASYNTGATQFQELIDKINSDKRERQVLENSPTDEPKKKRRGRPPKPVYRPSEMFQKTEETTKSDKKIIIKRK